MTTLREAALAVVDYSDEADISPSLWSWEGHRRGIAALRAALDQPDALDEERLARALERVIDDGWYYRDLYKSRPHEDAAAIAKAYREDEA